MLIVDGVRYKPWTPTDEEKEFHPLVKSQSKEIFGKDSIYFDVKTLIKSASGIGSIPDAYVIKYTEPTEWYVIENELATHSIYDHVVKQLTKFINGIENKDTRNQILDMLYSEINKNNNLKSELSTKTGTVEIYHFLSKLIQLKNPRIVVIVDSVTLDLEEACQALKYNPEIIEFKTFVREDNTKSYAHLFEPLTKTSVSSVIKETSKQSGWQNWGMMLENVDDPIRKTTMSLINKLTGLSSVVFKGKTACSAYIRQQRVKYGFVGLAPSKSELRIIVRSDPSISDPEGWISPKPVNWFTSIEEKNEREFKITDESQLDYAFELIKQSYAVVKKKEFQ